MPGTEIHNNTPLHEIVERLARLRGEGINPQFDIVAEGTWRVFDQDTGRTIAKGTL